MPLNTKVSVLQKRAFNQALICAKNIPTKALLDPAVLIRCLRSALRMTQRELAKQSGVPQAHIAKLESGQVDVRWGSIRRLCEAMYCELLILPRARAHWETRSRYGRSKDSGQRRPKCRESASDNYIELI